MVSRPGAPGPSSILSEKSSRMSSRPMSSGGRAPAVGLNGLGIGSPLDSFILFILFILLSLAVTISSCAVTPRPLPRCGDSTDRSPNTACTPSALILSRLVLSCLRERPAQHNPRHCLWRHPWGPRDSDDEHAGSIVDQSPIFRSASPPNYTWTGGGLRGRRWQGPWVILIKNPARTSCPSSLVVEHFQIRFT